MTLGIPHISFSPDKCHASEATLVLTRFGVAEHRGAAAERRAAAEVPAAATAAHAAPPYCRHDLYLLGGTHCTPRENIGRKGTGVHY